MVPAHSTRNFLQGGLKAAVGHRPLSARLSYFTHAEHSGAFRTDSCTPRPPGDDGDEKQVVGKKIK